MKIGENFVSPFGFEVSIKFVGPYGELVYEYDDGSIGFSENETDFFEQGWTESHAVDGWINVIHDTDLNEVFFEDAVYVTEENAINAFNPDGYTNWVRLDTTYISWSNVADV